MHHMNGVTNNDIDDEDDEPLEDDIVDDKIKALRRMMFDDVINDPVEQARKRVTKVVDLTRGPYDQMFGPSENEGT